MLFMTIRIACRSAIATTAVSSVAIRVLVRLRRSRVRLVLLLVVARWILLASVVGLRTGSG